MTTDLLEKRIRTIEKAEDWKDAIRMAAASFLENGSIRAPYINVMIHNVEVNGPYIAIMLGAAMPHSRVEDDALKMDISTPKLKDGVTFPQDDIVHLIIALSASDNDTHIQLLSDMVDVSIDEDKINGLPHTEHVEGIKRALAWAESSIHL